MDTSPKLKTVSVPEQFEPVFLKAQEYVARYFEGFRPDPEHGTIEIGGQRYILVRAASMSFEFFDMISSLYADRGAEEARRIASSFLFDIAHAVGKADARAFHQRMNVTDPVEKLSAGPVHFAHSGWAYVDILPESNPSPDEDYFLIYDHPYAFESEAWIRAGRTADFPVCVMNSGYSSGWCEESFGLPLVSAEIECRAKGDERCRFIMAPPSQIEKHLARHGIAAGEGEAGRTVRVPEFFERKRIEEQLRRSEEYTRAILAASATGIVVVDCETREVREANDAALRMMGLPRESVIGRKCHQFFCPRKEGECPALDEGREVSQLEAAVIRGDGSRVAVVKTAERATLGGRPCLVESVTDITERKNLEEQLRRSQKLEAVGQLAAGVAHEFNNVLMGITGYAQLMQEDAADENMKKDLLEIRKLSERGAAMAKQLLAFSRREDEAELVSFSLVPVVKSSMKMLRSAMPENIEIDLTMAEDTGSARLNPDQIAQIIVNLATNARDAMPDGGTLTIEAGNADLQEGGAEGVPPGRYVRLTITDTGTGMDEETREKIFEPFFTTKAPGKGTGLGMSTVYGLVEGHKGHMTVESQPGSGTSFSIYLPRSEGETPG